MGPSVQIIILNWNGYNDTSELLESLKKNNSLNFKIIVVDNNSSGNDVKLLENNYKDFIYILKCDSNLGFAGGNNIGIQKALESSPDYILLINNDTIVEPDFLNVLINKILSEKDIGIVAPQINYYDEPEKIWSAGGKINKIRGAGVALENIYEKDNIGNDRFVDFVSGCCMLIRKDVFRKAGLFDDSFFLYVEDTDFCFRVRKAGYKILLTPSSKIFHKVYKSSRENLPTLPLYFTTRNRLFLAKKNFPIYLPLTFFYIFLTMLLKCLAWLFTGKVQNINTVLKSFKDFLSRKMGSANFYS